MALVSLDVQDDDTLMPEGYDACPRIYLTAAQVRALGVTVPPRAGTQLTLTAVVEVSETRERVDDDADDKAGPDILLTLDVEFAELSPGPTGAKAQLYADA